MNEIGTLAATLRDYGPWGIVAVLVLAVGYLHRWIVTYLITQLQANTASTAAAAAAMAALRESIEALRQDLNFRDRGRGR